MKHTLVLRGVVITTACAAALSLAACNRNGAGQNGAYVSGSANSSLPVSDQSVPPTGSYRVAATTPPPPLPDYDQPPPPAAGYYWTPGYWDWNDDADDYYWVPGTWVEPPQPGLYWTPGYWRFFDGRYLFSDGYWGPEVGFYGGIDYGWGYDGSGYGGGRWQGRQFYYNDRANNLGGRSFSNVYSQAGAPTAPGGARRASYNGGPGGLSVAPTQTQIQAAQGRHAAPTRGQVEQARTARAEPQLRAGANRGAPPIAATPRVAAFHEASVVPARSAAGYTPPSRSVGGPAGPAGRGGGTPEGRQVTAVPSGRPDGPVSERSTGRIGGAAGEHGPAAPSRAAPTDARQAPVGRAPQAQADREPVRSEAARPAPAVHAAPPSEARAPAPAPRAAPPQARAAPEPHGPDKH